MKSRGRSQHGSPQQCTLQSRLWLFANAPGVRVKFSRAHHARVRAEVLWGVTLWGDHPA